MPTRWLLQYHGIAPADIELTHLHAVISSYFDDDAPGHPASGAAISHHQPQRKPYAVSAPFAIDGGVGIEIGTLATVASTRLLQRCVPGMTRFGRHFAQAVAPQAIAQQEWSHLGQALTGSAWTIEFQTPTSFTAGRHTTPLPTPSAILSGVRTAWKVWGPSGIDIAAPDRILRVSDIEGSTHVLKIGRKIYAGFVGSARYECDEPEQAAAVARLLALAEFCGVGAGTTRGLGVIRATTALGRH